MTLEGRVALVTGGASGIGRATALRLAEAGAAGVVIADLNLAGAQEVAAQIAAQGLGQALAVGTDVSDPASVTAMAAQAQARFGHVDILVNDAGICPVVPWEETTLEDWNRVLAVDLTGAFLCTKALLPGMRERRYGRIVYVSSTAAYVGSLVAHVAYGVAKAGLIALMKSVAKGFAAEGIRANAVSPGTTATPMTESLGGQAQVGFLANTPLRRQADPGEVADAVVYLVSDRSSYVTGHVLDVDGGFALR